MVDNSRIVHLTDVTDYETDMACGMKLWYSKYEKDNGIVPRDSVLPSRILQETHHDLRTISTMQDISATAVQEAIDPILAGLRESDKKNTRLMEVLYRRLGWFAAFALYIEPDIRKQFDNIPLDPWIYMDRDPLWVTVEPDRLLKNKFTKEVVYQEYVSTTTTSRRWQESWERQARPQVGMAAAREHIRGAVNYAQIRGLNLGIKGASRLIHPYVYGKYHKVSGLWTHPTYGLSNDKAMVERPVWEYPDGIVKWVVLCGEETAKNQFPTSPRIDPDNLLLVEWVAQRTSRERVIRTHKEVCQNNTYLRGVNFVKNPAACKPVFGDDCPYHNACWDLELRGKDLMRTGLFVKSTAVMDGVKSEVTVC